jgi:biopolymer transport protein ExbB
MMNSRNIARPPTRWANRILLLVWLLSIGGINHRAQAQGPPNLLPQGNFSNGQNNANGTAMPRQSFNNPQSSNAQSSNPASQGSFEPAARVANNPNAATPGNGSPSSTTTQANPAATKESIIPVRNLLQIFHDGGIMMYPIALCSFVLTVFAFERFIHLRTGRIIPRPFVKRLIEQLQQQQIEREEALELCDRNPSPMVSIFVAAIKRYGKSAVEIEQAVLDAGERESNKLRRYMRLLSAISNVAPLLGMLGTVLGMIQSFNDISGAQAMGRPEQLAGGIGEALLTTAAGLLVAIPAYLLYMYFLGRTDQLTMEMDRFAQQLVEVISAEGLQESDTSRPRTRTRKAA